MLMINMYILAAFTLLHLVTSNFLLIFIIRIGIGLMIAVDYTVGNALLTDGYLKVKTANDRAIC